MVAVIGVVVPAHNEEREILGCLASLRQAADHLAHRRPTVDVRIYVAADECTDQTVSHVRCADMGPHHFELLQVQDNNVGLARAAGVERFLKDINAEGMAADAAWISLTDADTRVPAHWFETQWQHAVAGVDLVIGTVEPRAETAASEVLAAWFERHCLEEDHPHIFGANLGVRSSWYTKVGGFAPLATGEDVELVGRLRRAGANVISTNTTRVATSARFIGRVPHGFSTYCRDL